MYSGDSPQPARNWASLNPDILQVLFCSLSSPSTPGIVHVTQTCSSWRAAARGVRGQQLEFWHSSGSRHWCDSICSWLSKYAATSTKLTFTSQSTSSISSRRLRQILAALEAAAAEAAAAGEPLPLQELWCPAPLQQLVPLLQLLPALQACGPLDVVAGANPSLECGTSSSSSEGSSRDRHELCSFDHTAQLHRDSCGEASDGSWSSPSQGSSSRGESLDWAVPVPATTEDLGALQACSHLQQLHLNLAPTCSCQPKAACSCWQPVMDALPPRLVQLQLHGPVQLDLASLQPHTQLEQLELHLYDVQDYTPLLQLPRLQRLAVGLSSHEHISRLVPVKHLVKELTGPVGGDLQIPAELTALTYLVLFGSHVVPPDTICHQLQALSIAVYWRQGVEAMGRLLQQCRLFPHLRHLELRTEQGAQHLITALHHLTQLTRLNLHLTAASSSREEPRWSARWAGAVRELTGLRCLSVPAQLMETKAPWLSQLRQLEELTVEGDLLTAAQLCGGRSKTPPLPPPLPLQQQQPMEVEEVQQQGGHMEVSQDGVVAEAAAAGVRLSRCWPHWWHQGQASSPPTAVTAIELQQLPKCASSQRQQQHHQPAAAQEAQCSSSGCKCAGSSTPCSQPRGGGDAAPTCSHIDAPASLLRVLRVEGKVAPGLLPLLQQVAPHAACVVLGGAMPPAMRQHDC